MTDLDEDAKNVFPTRILFEGGASGAQTYPPLLFSVGKVQPVSLFSVNPVRCAAVGSHGPWHLGLHCSAFFFFLMSARTMWMVCLSCPGDWCWRRHDVVGVLKLVNGPELKGAHGRARLVVLGVEVGGRWSAEASVFLRCLAAAKARGALPWLEGRVRAAWPRRWQELLGCAAARTFSCSLLDGPAASGGDGAIPR